MAMAQGATRTFIPGSNSRLDLFEKCPLWFRLQHLDKIPFVPTPALEVGRAAHEFFEAYIRHCVETGQRTDLAWRREHGEDFARGLGEKEAEDLRGIIERFCGSYLVEEKADHVGVEIAAAFDKEWRQVDWKDWDRVWFRFKIDKVYLTEALASAGDGVIGKRLVIEDFKTDRVMESHQTVQTSKQLRRYAWAAVLLWPEAFGDRASVRLHYARYGVTREATIERGAIAAVREEIERGMERLNTERDWHARPGIHCGWCPYTTRCEMFKAVWGTKPLDIESAEDAVRVAREFLFLKGLIKAYEERLRVHAAGSGPVPLGDGSFVGFASRKKEAVSDVEGAVMALLESGVDRETVWRRLSLSKSDLWGLGRSVSRGGGKELAERLSPFVRSFSRTEFRAFKDATGEDSDD